MVSEKPNNTGVIVGVVVAVIVLLIIGGVVAFIMYRRRQPGYIKKSYSEKGVPRYVAGMQFSIFWHCQYVDYYHIAFLCQIAK